jgi:hypothetical protein
MALVGVAGLTLGVIGSGSDKQLLTPGAILIVGAVIARAIIEGRGHRDQ